MPSGQGHGCPRDPLLVCKIPFKELIVISIAFVSSHLASEKEVTIISQFISGSD